jgi:hypothetical protein
VIQELLKIAISQRFFVSRKEWDLRKSCAGAGSLVSYIETYIGSKEVQI